ncbi:MAG: GNAT family N-acetyltransferase [Anaerolineales bacterium]|nr:GNAT family N-acetyltransferase [Anaerolineales bacterium]
MEANPAAAGRAVEGLRISPVSLRDLRQVLRLERVCFGKDAWPLLDVMSALVWPGGVRLKAAVEGRLIGMAIAEPAWDEGVSMITTIGVDPEFRRRGVGSALLARCESLLPGDTVRLTVRADNLAAIRMYQRFGYANHSKVLKYYRDGQAGWIMEKKLSRFPSAAGGSIPDRPNPPVL